MVKSKNRNKKTELNTYRESDVKGDIVFAENVQKSAYVIRSNDTPSWRTVSCALLTLKVENFYLPFRHTNTNSVHDGMAIYFAFESINKK
jgi:hypothetical protein